MAKTLIAFDLDGTLAESKQAVDDEMAKLLARLSAVATVAIMSGGDWPQFEQQLVGNLPAASHFDKFYLLPTSGTKLYQYDGSWKRIYADIFSDDERQEIEQALTDAVQEAGFAGDKSWGEKIEDRGSQITFSGLGQEAPLDAKHAWDPDFAKRKLLQKILTPRLPGFAVRVGGSTSIDITRAGVDKGTGMQKLAGIVGIPPEQIIFMGDAVYPGGNDYPVREVGIYTIAVANIGETKRAIEAVLFCLGG
ncbi:HAD-IIB family hydrolase [Sphingomonas profundi]|uniref:HAD-IIB family hydrolase n=1 Tax=Alterirhizorhabdus profundi TaxID=2681549 RepID=UPI0012E779D8|nr:HAD-IIB family hydrolase [Sphingomonas profundi]